MLVIPALGRPRQEGTRGLPIQSNQCVPSKSGRRCLTTQDGYLQQRGSHKWPLAFTLMRIWTVHPHEQIPIQPHTHTKGKRLPLGIWRLSSPLWAHGCRRMHLLAYDSPASGTRDFRLRVLKGWSPGMQCQHHMALVINSHFCTHTPRPSEPDKHIIAQKTTSEASTCSSDASLRKKKKNTSVSPTEYWRHSFLAFSSNEFSEEEQVGFLSPNWKDWGMGWQ